MDWQQQIFIYCERGGDPTFWAEPFNAATNAAFIIAALVAAGEYARQPKSQRGVTAGLLIALVIVIGVGSFLFHTTATRWAQLADTAPIGLFMLAYLAYVLRRYLALNWLFVAGGVLIFAWMLRSAGEVSCRPDFLPVTAAAGARCLNGTIAYLPAFAVLALMALVLCHLRHPAWRALATAAFVFLISMTFRTLDLELCDATRVAGHAVGMHFLWHALNALTLYLLLSAAIRHGSQCGLVRSRVGEV